MLGLKSFLLLIVSSLVFTWQSDLGRNIDNSFKKQGKIVTFSIQIQDKFKINPELIKTIKYPAEFDYGYNEIVFYLKNNKEINHKFKLDIKERIPVTLVNLVPGQKINRANLSYSWIKISRLTKFIIRDIDDLQGFISKYYKNEGEYFYNNDVKQEEVIRNGDECLIHLIYNSIQITMPGISLKNGSIGSKIKVINKTTNKTLDVYVINSKNVEVKM